MPYKRKYAGKKRKRSKRVYRPRKKARPYLPVGGFSNKMLVKLRYVQLVTLDAGAGTYAVNEFRANSLFDPDKSGVGHQPSNFDKLATIYDRYTVLGSKCTIYWVPTSSTIITPPPLLALHVSEDGSDIATAHAAGGISNVLEQPRLSRSTQYVGIYNGTGTVLTRYFSAKKFFGVKDIVGESPYSSDITGNPTEGAFFEVAAISPDDSVNPGSISVRVEIEYIAMMTEPKITDAS